jgi:branched-chain amino acid aminotransferase
LDLEWLYLDGDLVSAREAGVDPLGGGLLYGLGVFESFRVTAGRAFRLERHYRRARSGADALGLEISVSLADLEDGVRRLAAKAGLDESRMRVTFAARRGNDTLCLITVRPLTDYPDSLNEEGASAVISSFRRDESSPLARLKTLNYLGNLLARREAREAGAAEAILLNRRGAVAEGAASNVFAVSGGRLLTPRVEDGALPGITREAVLEVAAIVGLAAAECETRPDDLCDAEEAFFTNAVAGLVPLVDLDGKAVGAGRPGPWTRALAERYESLRRANAGSPTA